MSDKQKPYMEQSPFVDQNPCCVNTILEEREKTHGDFTNHAEITQEIKNTMHGGLNWIRLSSIQREALDMVAHKIGRIMSGDPDLVDHWDDSAGYMTLVAQRLRNKTRISE
jgi:hypothetical protein